MDLVERLQDVVCRTLMLLKLLAKRILDLYLSTRSAVVVSRGAIIFKVLLDVL